MDEKKENYIISSLCFGIYFTKGSRCLPMMDALETF